MHNYLNPLSLRLSKKCIPSFPVGEPICLSSSKWHNFICGNFIGACAVASNCYNTLEAYVYRYVCSDWRHVCLNVLILWTLRLSYNLSQKWCYFTPIPVSRTALQNSRVFSKLWFAQFISIANAQFKISSITGGIRCECALDNTAGACMSPFYINTSFDWLKHNYVYVQYVTSLFLVCFR